MLRGVVVGIVTLAAVAIASPAVAAPRGEALRIVNERRFSAGCDPLEAAGGRLLRSARAHSREMAEAGELDHSELRIGGWSKVGEVVGFAGRWHTIVDLLFESREHRRIFLDCDYDRIALGFVFRDSVWLTGRLYAI